MTIVQSASGTSTGASFTVTLPAASNASNIVAVFVAGNTIVNTPAGWTADPNSQVNEMGHYHFRKAGDGTNSWAFTNTSGQLTWVAIEIQGGSFISSAGQNNTAAANNYNTPNNTPTAGTRIILASIGSLTTGSSVRTVSSWTNSFTELADLCQASADYPMQGVAYLDNVAANGSTAYSTTATFSSANCPSRSALIASYATSVGGASLAATPADTVGITDTASASISSGSSLTASPGDTAGITDSATTAMVRAVTVSDAVGITDTGAPQQLDIGLTLAESIGITDAASSTSARALAVSDLVGITDSSVTAAARVSGVSDTVGLTDATQADKGQLAGISDTVGITDAAGAVADRVAGPTDGVGMTDAVDPVAVRVLTVSDTAGITDNVAADLTVGGNSLTANIGDTVGILDAAATVAIRAVTITDTIDLVDAPITAAARVLSINDTLGITDAADGQITVGGNALTAMVNDSLGITDTAGHTAARAVAVADVLDIVDAIALTKIWTVTISDTLSAVDSVTAPGPYKDYTITTGRAVLGNPNRRVGRGAW